MKKYFIIDHSTKKIECITILWWVLVLLFIHLTSRLASTFSCTLYHAFTLSKYKRLKFYKLKLSSDSSWAHDLLLFLPIASFNFEDTITNMAYQNNHNKN
jgi:hypothetical protein